MRTFIAIDLPEHVKSRIFHEFEKIYKRNLFYGKITEKDNLHLTLKFLGEVPEEKVQDIKKRLSQIKSEKILCKISKTRIFDDENYIKIIWVDLTSDNDELQKLQKKIDEKLPESFSKKEFSSHITTVRVKGFRYNQDKKKLIEELKKINFNLDFEADEFLLMKSELFPEGPKYKIIEKFPLG